MDRLLRRMMPVVLAAPLIAAAVPAAAQLACADRDTLVGSLAARYGERPVAQGVAIGGQLAEILVSREGTWTILVTLPRGPSCILLAGDGWRPVRPAEVAERVSVVPSYP